MNLRHPNVCNDAIELIARMVSQERCAAPERPRREAFHLQEIEQCLPHSIIVIDDRDKVRLGQTDGLF
jgi:hypothetical protein